MDDDQFQRGLRTRQHVLGTEYVAASTERVTEVGADFERFVTEHYWGHIWARPGLTTAQRSLLTVVLLTALGRARQLRLQIRGALRNGVTAEELAEAMMHASIYCGAPAALDGLAILREALADGHDEQSAGSQ